MGVVRPVAPAFSEPSPRGGFFISTQQEREGSALSDLPGIGSRSSYLDTRLYVAQTLGLAGMRQRAQNPMTYPAPRLMTKRLEGALLHHSLKSQLLPEAGRYLFSGAGTHPRRFGVRDVGTTTLRGLR